MLKAVQALDLAPGAIILDVASGPGEPALTIAAALPHVTVSWVTWMPPRYPPPFCYTQYAP